MIRQILIFPDTPHLVTRSARRLTPFRILLELRNGLVSHLVVSQRTPPDLKALAAAAPTLIEAERCGYPLTHATDLLHSRHGIPAEVIDSPFGETCNWNVEPLVSSCLAEESSNRKAGELAAFRRQLLDETHSSLRQRMDRFIAGLDAECIERLGNGESLRPSRYNYLAAGDARLRRNRRQAAQLFPWLLGNLLWRDNLSTLAGRIRRSIDAGEPLIGELACRFNVSPSAIKAMKHCSLELLNGSWHGDIRRLAWALESITPEFRPRTPQAWQRMGGVVEAIERVTGASMDSQQNRLWLAAAAKRNFELPLIGDAAALTTGLADMRNALREVLALRVSGHADWHAGWLNRNPAVASAIEQVIRRLLGHIEFARLLEIVRRWQDAFRRQIAADSEENALIRGLTWRAPLEEFRTGDRVISPLLSAAELIEEGQKMEHCVGSYISDCRMGRLQIWSVRDTLGQRRSTLATRFERESSVWRATISQHRARLNEKPDPSSYAAARELLKILNTRQAEMQPFREWCQTIARLSPKDRSVLLATNALNKSLEDVLPKKFAIEILAAEVRQLRDVPLAAQAHTRHQIANHAARETLMKQQAEPIV